MIVSKGKWIRLEKLNPPVDLSGIKLPENIKLPIRAEWLVAGVPKGVNDGIKLGGMILVKTTSVQEIETEDGPRYFVHEENVRAVVMKERMQA